MRKWSAKVAGILIWIMMFHPIGVCAEEMTSSEVETVENVVETESNLETVMETESIETSIETSETLEIEPELMETSETIEEMVIETEVPDSQIMLESSAGCVTIEVSGVRHYEYSYKALEFMNEIREENGLEPLVMDATLLQTALLRCAECTLRFEGAARPNGTSVESTIARHGSCGLSRADYYWLDESSMQRYILYPAFKSVGIGCFERLCYDYGITWGNGIEIPTYGTVPEGKCSVCGKSEGIAGFVIRLYDVCLGREADEVGMSTWVNLLRTQQSSGRDVAYGFIFSKEFINKKYNNEDYVEHLYEAFMGRSSDPKGKATWLNLLASGWTREQVFDGFVGSDEFTAICNGYGITRG